MPYSNHCYRAEGNGGIYEKDSPFSLKEVKVRGTAMCDEFVRVYGHSYAPFVQKLPAFAERTHIDQFSIHPGTKRWSLIQTHTNNITVFADVDKDLDIEWAGWLWHFEIIEGVSRWKTRLVIDREDLSPMKTFNPEWAR